MGYMPSYDSLYEAASTPVDSVTISGNTTDNVEEQARAMGIETVRDINGNAIGYEKNISVNTYENGEYVERTYKVPLYPSKNPNSTASNLIIDYKPSPSYTTTDNEHYEPGSVDFVMNTDDYFKNVMSAVGYDVDYEQLNPDVMMAMWDYMKEDVSHQNGIVNDPIMRALTGDASGAFNTDHMALSRLKLSDAGLKYLSSENNIAAILKAAAAVGMIDVNDVIEDDPATREYFTLYVHDGDTVTLKSPSATGGSFDENWYASYIRPMLYENLNYLSTVYPTPEEWVDGFDTIPEDIDNDVYDHVGKHINIWFARYWWPIDMSDTSFQVNVDLYGLYLDPNQANAKVLTNEPTHGYAILETYGTIYNPYDSKYDMQAYRYHPGAQGITWNWRSGRNAWPNTFILVYDYELFMAFLSQMDINTYKNYLGRFYVFANCHKSPGVPGVSKKDNALKITANSTVAEIKTQMQNQYPDWYNNVVIQNIYDIDNNTTNPVTYLPIGIGTDTPQVSTPTRAEIEKANVYNYNYTYNQTPTNPSPMPDYSPTHGMLKSNKFWTVYSPNQAQIDALGSILWDQDVIDILKQAFVNPTDGIISFQQIYCPVTRSKESEICLGAYNTHVRANVVEDFVTEIDMGYALVPRFYNDPRDFTETTVNVFLPFIGFRELDPRDVIGGALRLRYRIDILTGTCVAFISPRKKEANNLALDTNLTTCSYMFEGNCAVQLPITAADRSRMLSSILGGGAIGIKAGGKVGAFNGALAGGVIGATLGALQGLQKNIYRSGDISANAGALALSNIPYILIDRQVPADAYQYPKFYGKPNNETIALELCQGFTRVKEVIFNTINASEVEKQEIDILLKEGIII